MRACSMGGLRSFIIEALDSSTPMARLHPISAPMAAERQLEVVIDRTDLFCDPHRWGHQPCKQQHQTHMGSPGSMA
ncbi:MAG: hypothetical protein VKI63_03695 [Cyanobium sp.]|nr:hypothetical protein [Cyanobium sp.]